MRLLLVPLVRTTISISAARRTLSSDIIMAASAPARLRIVQFQDSSKRSEGEGGGSGTPPRVRVGAELRCGGPVVDVTAIDPSIPSDMRSFLKQWDQSTALTQKALEAAEASGCHVLEQGQFTLKAPIYDPQKVIGVGMNYVDHCTEQNFPVPKEPILFSKFSSSITEPYGDVIIPAETQCLDYEVELAFIICKKGKYIKEAEAMSHVAGFTVAHDVSARDWQMHKNGGQWLLGKTFDTFCPLGPALVTRAAISDPHKLGIRCRLNGEVVQNSNTDQLIHKTEQLVAFISRFVTLQPGDVVLTGTPPGVGCFKKPPVWLKKGDVVECEIDELGTIRNVIQ